MRWILFHALFINSGVTLDGVSPSVTALKTRGPGSESTFMGTSRDIKGMRDAGRQVFGSVSRNQTLFI